MPPTPCSSDTVHECPDYQTAGENSCFFNKNNTSIWVNYNITVVATNELGSTFSDSVDVDVVYIGERPALFFCFSPLCPEMQHFTEHKRTKELSSDKVKKSRNRLFSKINR